eukprot:scaffold1819_cov160-Amphora_coffeaeformis.AAC.7
MLVEVIDEQSAQDSTDENHNRLEEDLLEHLATHYAQPIHTPSVRSSTRYYYHDDDDDDDDEEEEPLAVPAVVQYCYEQLVLPRNGDDAILSAATTTDGASRRRLRPSQQQIILNLLSLYPSRIRQFLFSPERTVRTTGVAVLYHYDWLLSLLCNSDKDSSIARDDNGRIDNNVTSLPKKNRRNSHPDHDERLVESLQRLMSDLSICVEAAVHSESSSEGGKAIKTANLGGLLQHYVIPTMFRLWHKILCRQKDSLDNIIACQCATRLLAWGEQGVRPTLVAPGLSHALSALGVIEEESAQWYTRTISDKLPKVWQGLDWNHAVELVTDEWSTPLAQEQATACWSCWSDNDDLRECQKATCERLGWNTMATAVRQYFFGKDDAILMMDEDETAIVRTRLHLGRTVPEEPVEYEKPYRAIPSRMHAACVFISLLDRLTINANMIQELMPILYELLAAAQENIQATGACCLYHLLQISKGQHSVWPPVILSNLAAAMDLAVQTCRKGPVVTLLGAAQVALLRRLSPPDALQQRRKASQQWLMILNKSLYNEELVWGILSGALVRLGADHADGDDNEGLELGRLVLSCLLPLIRRDEGTATAAAGVLADEIQWLALVTLTRWLVAAHAVVIRHEGKLIGSFLLCLGRTADDASAVFAWAKHAAAMLVVATNNRDTVNSQASPVRSAKLEQIIEAGVYQDRLVLVAQQILQDAQMLADEVKQRDE